MERTFGKMVKEVAAWGGHFIQNKDLIPAESPNEPIVLVLLSKVIGSAAKSEWLHN